MDIAWDENSGQQQLQRQTSGILANEVVAKFVARLTLHSSHGI